MIKSGSALYERYDMTHGELILASKIEETIPLYIVVLTLYSKLSSEERRNLENKPFEFPPEAVISIHYKKADGEVVNYTSNEVLQLDSDAILELRDAMERQIRSVVSYTLSSKKLPNTARLMAVYSNREWQCVLATSISYAEANFIYSLLSRYGLTTQKPGLN